MSSYDDGSGSSAGGEVGGSTEMELQELVVDFTDDGRILLEVKGVKVGPMWQCRDWMFELVIVQGGDGRIEGKDATWQRIRSRILMPRVASIYVCP